MPALAILAFAAIGFAALFGILIADCIGHARHVRAMEEANRRRHGLS